MTTNIGTPHWMAPEIILGHRYEAKADVYSYGIVLWEMPTRISSYQDIPSASIMHLVT